MAESRIIVAIDNKIPDEIMQLVRLLQGKVAGFKFNDALDTNAERIIGFVKKEAPDHIIWSDIKAHDIPQTVKNRIQNYANLGAHWVTVHASGGIEMMRYAVSVKPAVNVLAVTVLTSLDEDDCNLSYNGPVKPTVLRFALMAKEANTWGLVCSGQELEFLKKKGITGIKKVVPAIRPDWFGKKDDQKRKMNPTEAIQAGADYLVIGRPIHGSDDPVEAAKKINEEIEAALAS